MGENIKNRIISLINKYEQTTLSNIERDELLDLLEQYPDLFEAYFYEKFSTSNLSTLASSLNAAEILEKVLSVDKTPVKKHTHKRFKLVIRWAVAASLLIASLSGLYKYRVAQTLQKNIFAKEIAPGENKAILTLSDGRTISLTDAQTGNIASQPGVEILKIGDGRLLYNTESKQNPGTVIEAPVRNTISTPIGGQWQLQLPDGTKVWLNAMSSLTYPLNFSNQKERRVELIGEAYFEVAKDAAHPFVVSTNNQDVKVLGTHFNIFSYDNENVIKTTLLEGSVEVKNKGNSKTYLLYPGQQAKLVNNHIQVDEVDVEEAIAWKNGYFMFNNESLVSILKKIERWYGVRVEYMDEEVKNVTYLGILNRFDNASQVLRKLQDASKVIRFEIENKKVLVYKNQSLNQKE